MINRLLTFLILVLTTSLCRGQFSNFGDVPIEINAEGGTKFEGGVAVAENNVVIQYGAATIYSDYAEYNPETRDLLLRGNVRIYRDKYIFVGERAVYNLETKKLHAADFRGEFFPFLFSANTVSTLSANTFETWDATFTTSDSSKPDYYLKAKTVRIYSKDHLVLSNVTVYIGKTPILWLPYLFQSLNREQGFSINPGNYSNWGTFVLAEYHFPIGEDARGTLHLDPYSRRGVGMGFDTKFSFGKDEKSWGNFHSYYIDDSQPNINYSGISRLPIDRNRYRVGFQNRLYITDDIYTNIDVNKLSDPYITQDFNPREFQLNPQPTNYLSITKWDNDYTVTGLARAQVNSFFAATERLPEFSLDIKRQPLFRTPLFYESETSIGKLVQNFGTVSGTLTTLTPPPDFSSTRLDTFHQILFPQVYGGWFSFIPQAGLRGTYYSNSLNGTGDTAGGIFRAVVNAGFDASFKVSREYSGVESRQWGLDGLRHVFQPYTDLSYAYSSKSPKDIMQYDGFSNTTQLPIFDFPQFNGIDSISTWTVWQIGMRNIFQTRRDGETQNWLEFDSYFNVNIHEPYTVGTSYENETVSEVFDKMHWYPLPWLSISFDSIIPVFDRGFTELNTDVAFTVTKDWRLNVGQMFINNNPYFPDSNLITFGTYVRMNENWGFRISERYEAAEDILESQRYELFRDLSSWIASLGMVVINNNGGARQYAVVLTFTLKDAPAATLPFNFRP